MTDNLRTDPDATRHALDRLSSHFASLITRADAPELDRIVIDILEQIAHALDVDHVSLLRSTGATVTPVVLKSWKRPGVALDGAGQPAPVTIAQGHLCALAVGTWRSPADWTSGVHERLRLLTDLLMLAAQRADSARELDRMKGELAQFLTAPAAPYQPLDEDEFEDIVGNSEALREAIARCQEVAPTGASVVLLGETGTGKELFARAVHNRSTRRDRPFVRVNCAALPPTLIESELFGHERGAFTGAVSLRQGRFELADKGTIFLDEIGDLPLEVQAKLLRVLQEGEFERVGSSTSRKVDVRIVAATHHDLDAAMRNGAFRADLYYRLNVFPIALPPLRERTEDIQRLVWYFINRRQRALNRKISRIPAAVFQALEQHSWPGNVRELENVVERAMIHSTGDTLVLDSPPGFSLGMLSVEGGTLEAAERRHIEHALRRCGWRINGVGNAAERLGLHPNTLRFRMKKLGIRRPAGVGVVRDFKRMLA
jgi:transcriptional regulator with GAF, ATPase, and Fis domain